MAWKSPLSQTLLPFLQQEYLQAALQDNGTQLTRAKSPVALTNVDSTEQEALCSHIRVKYLLFISAKMREKWGEKEGNNKDRVIKSDRTGGKVSCRLWDDDPWQPSWRVLNNLVLCFMQKIARQIAQKEGATDLYVDSSHEINSRVI